jgi:PLD-like domain
MAQTPAAHGLEAQMTSRTRVRAGRIAAVGIAIASLAVGAGAAHVEAAGAAVSYKTIFQDPGPNPAPDLSLELHAVALIDATPAGERITFAFRDFNRLPVAEALISAHLRGVHVDGVVDGGERAQPAVQALLAALGPDRFVVCGSPTFEYHSCIASPDKPGLQHNKFLTFSQLADGREHVVLQTSKNFFGPSQLTYYNDMVEIAGDSALHGAYVEYLFALKAQVRSDDHYVIAPDGGRNTIYTSPRRQADPRTDDIIVERMDEIDCSEGGSPTGKGLVRIANMAFRTERAVIMEKLVDLERQGCDIDVVVSNADGDIMAGLVSAGVPVHPFFMRATGTRPQVIVHDKFWLVDAKSTVTGARSRIVYAGSSNWRGDQQRSDDLLLRIVDDGVYSAYSEYWRKIRSRAVSDLPRTGTDRVNPASSLVSSPGANRAGWHDSDVTLRVAGSDGHLQTASGLKRLHVEMSGAQAGTWDFPGETDGYNVQELVVSAEGTTTITYFSEDNKGNREPARSQEVRIDKTAPTLTGLPRDCSLWPPNGQLVHVADVAASDAGSGVADLTLSGGSDDVDDRGDIVIDGGAVDLRAEHAARGGRRTYTIRATATDDAGNVGSGLATCEVPRSQGIPPNWAIPTSATSRSGHGPASL